MSRFFWKKPGNCWLLGVMWQHLVLLLLLAAGCWLLAACCCDFPRGSPRASTAYQACWHSRETLHIVDDAAGPFVAQVAAAVFGLLST